MGGFNGVIRALTFDMPRFDKFVVEKYKLNLIFAIDVQFINVIVRLHPHSGWPQEALLKGVLTKTRDACNSEVEKCILVNTRQLQVSSYPVTP